MDTVSSQDSRFYCNCSLAVIIIASCLSLTAVQAEPTMYRYKNDEGTLVTSHILPPDQTEKGYQVITPRGDVIKTVQAAPSKEARLELLEEQRSADEQTLYDKKLMLKYGSLAELRQAQKRKMGELEGKLTVLNGNLGNIKNQIESEQYKAANYERQGRTIPEYLFVNLDELYGNLERTESLLKRRTAEVEEEKRGYAYEIQRFKELKGLR